MFREVCEYSEVRELLIEGKGVTGKGRPGQAKVLFRYLSTFGPPIIERPL